MKRLIVISFLLWACGSPSTSSPEVIVVGGRSISPQEAGGIVYDATNTAVALATMNAGTEAAHVRQQTQAVVVMTSTAAAVGITQTHAAETPTAAAIALEMVNNVNAGTSTAFAEMNNESIRYRATSTAIAINQSHESAMASLKEKLVTSLIALIIVVCLAVAVLWILIVGWLSRFGRMRVRYLPLLSGRAVFDTQTGVILENQLTTPKPEPVPQAEEEDDPQGEEPAPGEPAEAQPPEADPDFEDREAYYTAWREAILNAATVAGVSGGWSNYLMCEQYPKDARPISEDDRARVVFVLIEAKILIKGHGSRGTQYAEGESFMTIRIAIEAGRIQIPPYPDGGRPPPKVIVSLARRNANYRNATQTAAEGAQEGQGQEST